MIRQRAFTLIEVLVAMAVQRCNVIIYQDDKLGWDYPQSVAKKLNWGKELQIRDVPKFNE